MTHQIEPSVEQSTQCQPVMVKPALQQVAIEYCVNKRCQEIQEQEKLRRRMVN